MREAAFDVILAKDKSKYSRSGNVESMGTRLHIPKVTESVVREIQLGQKIHSILHITLGKRFCKTGKDQNNAMNISQVLLIYLS